MIQLVLSNDEGKAEEKKILCALQNRPDLKFVYLIALSSSNDTLGLGRKNQCFKKQHVYLTFLKDSSWGLRILNLWNDFDFAIHIKMSL